MPTGLKLFAVLCCLSPWLGMLVTHAHQASLNRAPVTHERMTAQRAADQSAKTRSFVAITAAEFGAVLLLIDAMLREYDAPRGWPIAIAVVGLISFGLLSLVYYVIWGWQPTRRETPLAEDFCDTCRAQTLDRSAPSLMMHNMLGTQFLGRADRCATCGSSVRTVWFTVILPLLPLGSYRVLPVGKAMVHKSWFRSRKAHWKPAQVATVYSFVAIVALMFWLAVREG